MGKDGFMTPKQIANRIKAKGLQKLKWYCQACQKQCRDENGFKCHQTSASHLRNMQLFGENPEDFVDEHSKEFEEAFLEHLKRAHPFSRVLAKNVYNEFIADRHHIHMNSTKWLTLTEFVKYLGKEGKCKVDETEKGWWITLIMKDPMQEIEEGKKLKRVVAEKAEEERHMMEINAQVERARKAARLSEMDDVASARPEGDVLIKTDDKPLVLALAPTTAAAGAATEGEGGRPGGGLPPRAPTAGLKLGTVARPKAAFGDDDEDDQGGPSGSGRPPGKSSKLDELMKKELEAKAKHQAELAQSGSGSGKSSGGRIAWLATGIVVKVMSKELEKHGYYKKKGVVDRVIDRYVGEITMLDSGDVLRVDQEQLETVIPQVDGRVLMVAGPHRGHRAVLREINIDKFKARVCLSEGPEKGQDVWAPYEDICKLDKK